MPIKFSGTDATPAMSCSVRETQWSSSSLRATRINRVSPARAAAVPTSSTKRRWRCASSAQRSDCIGAGLHPRQSRPVRQLPGVGLTAEESFSCTALSSKVASAGVLIVRMNPSVRCDFSLLRQLDLDRRRKSPGFFAWSSIDLSSGPATTLASAPLNRRSAKCHRSSAHYSAIQLAQ
jgi:hypothetical protein